MASGRSQLGADIHEIDNAASRTGRLLDEVAGDSEAVAERRDEIIAALDVTAKPYFGDVETMTYAQWLRRYLELTVGIDAAKEFDCGADLQDAIVEATSSPWLDITWRARFGEMLQRTEARLHPVDRGPIPTLFADAETLERPRGCNLRTAGVVPGLLDHRSASRRRLVLHLVVQDAGQGRSTSFPSSTVTCVVGGAATPCGRHTTPATPPIRFASSPAPLPSPASPVSTSRSVTCSIASRRRPTTNWLLPEPTPVALASRRHQDSAPGLLDAVLSAPDLQWAGRLTQNPVRRLGDLDEWSAESADKAVHGTTGSSP